MSGALRIFINYRRDDTAGDAILLRDRLGERFGRENIFLDTQNLEPGTRWLDEIKARSDASGVFLSLIGPHWVSILKAREADTAEDYTRVEIEYALRRGTSVHVIPVLLDRAVAPVRERLPRSLWPLAALQAEQLRYATFETDVARLITRLETIAHEPAVPPEPERAESRVDKPRTPLNQIAPAPDDDHYEMVLRHMAEEGTVVSLLGTRINPADHARARALYPDGDELAMDLAERFGIKTPAADLAEIAQTVYTSDGPARSLPHAEEDPDRSVRAGAGASLPCRPSACAGGERLREALPADRQHGVRHVARAGLRRGLGAL